MLTVDQVAEVALLAAFMVGTGVAGVVVAGRPPQARHAAGGNPPAEGARSAGAGALLIPTQPLVVDRHAAVAGTAPRTPPDRPASEPACRVCRDGHEVVGHTCFRCGTPAARPYVVIGAVR